MKVFVYGTLKKGGSLFLEEHARNIRKARIKGKLYTVDGVWYPFANIEEDGIIQGEIHEYDELMLPILDRIENGYDRRRVQTLAGEYAWVYHSRAATDDGYFKPVPSGFWDVDEKEMR